MKLYCSSFPTYINDLGQLRWFMFSMYQTESNKLPPKLGALRYKIMRSHYIALVWGSSDKAKQCLPNPCQFGWKDGGDIYDALMTDELPAPEAVIEMSLCACTTGCKVKPLRCSL